MRYSGFQRSSRLGPSHWSWNTQVPETSGYFHGIAIVHAFWRIGEDSCYFSRGSFQNQRVSGWRLFIGEIVRSILKLEHNGRYPFISWSQHHGVMLYTSAMWLSGRLIRPEHNYYTVYDRWSQNKIKLVIEPYLLPAPMIGFRSPALYWVISGEVSVCTHGRPLVDRLT